MVQHPRTGLGAGIVHHYALVTVGDTPEAVHAQEFQDIADADPDFHIRHLSKFRSAVGEEHRRLNLIQAGEVRQIAVVLVGKAAPGGLGRDFFTQSHPPQERNLAKEISPEAMVVEHRHPGIRSEFHIVHAGKCLLVQQEYQYYSQTF